MYTSWGCSRSFCSSRRLSSPPAASTSSSTCTTTARWPSGRPFSLCAAHTTISATFGASRLRSFTVVASAAFSNLIASYDRSVAMPPWNSRVDQWLTTSRVE
ncbi:hypothetical protein TraAM80_05089 [Trypanosoma rangeli]|uniref:Uncharacterized protein n=1 Tax=Trypanosoma rangeli TaxID=5698 RepID=A0A422NGI6_TRYRA|nr:uncharacterized protein TraAM80_05089 [Trypanosoma rangeli]RNF04582.1 hypothetical protein TraAM80_05089 [Trypanosoma rangeli]|eukprot:RNF04582.1 hypothetical protein TraAM80_05089 [Trypanosoma rangeli]